MTKVPKPTNWAAHYDLTYDAWNRLVDVDDGATDVASYEYDGLNRRIEKRLGNDASPTTVYDYYYSSGWQVLEVHEDDDTANPFEQFVWHTNYVDAVLVRYFDEDTDGILSENKDGEHYYLQDATFNVTAIIDASANVLERYDYTPYGEVAFTSASFTDLSPNESVYHNPQLFTGRRYDSDCGTYYFRNCFFAPALGHFCERDPAGVLRGVKVL